MSIQVGGGSRRVKPLVERSDAFHLKHAAPPRVGMRPEQAQDDGCFFGLSGRWGGGATTTSLQIACAGSEPSHVLDAFRAMPTTHVALVHDRSGRARARNLRDKFCAANVPTRLWVVPETPYWGVLEGVNGLLHEARLEFDEVCLNVASGDMAAGCALTTAAYLHGVKAFHLVDGQAMFLPVLPRDAREGLGDARLALLLALAQAAGGRCSLRALERERGWSRADIDALVGGEPERKGLRDLGLVAMRRRFGRPSYVALTAQGWALARSGLLASPPRV